MDRVAWMIRALLCVLAFAVVWGPHVALAAGFGKTFSKGGRSGAYSQSASGTTWTAYKKNGTYQVDPKTGTASSTGQYGLDPYGGGVGAYGTVNVPVGKGYSVPVTVGDLMSPQNLAKAAASAAGRYMPAAAVASLLYEFLDDAGVVNCDGYDAWCKSQDGGQMPVIGGSGAMPVASTLAAAVVGLCAGHDPCTVVHDSGSQTVSCWAGGYHGPYLPSCAQYEGQFFYEVPIGWRTVGYSETCPVGYELNASTGWCVTTATIEPFLSDAERDAQIENYGNTMVPPPWLPAFAKELIEEWNETVTISDTSSIPATGPATVDGPTSTTSNPDGSTTTSSTQFHATYEGDSVTIVETTTITHVDAENNTTTTTVTGPVEDVPEAPGPLLCEAFPDIVACWTSGEVPVPELVEEEVQSLDFDPVAVAGASGSCPAPIEISVSGQSFAISWASVCQFATGINPIVIALGWIAAAGIVFGSVRGGSA